MMTGQVIGRHALLPVTFRLTDHPDLTIEYVVDTGYTDYLTLPRAAVAESNCSIGSSNNELSVKRHRFGHASWLP